MDELFEEQERFKEDNEDPLDEWEQKDDDPSDDSFIVDDDRSLGDFEGKREDFDDDDYDFLFGEPPEEKKEEKVKKRVKDLERLLVSRGREYEEFEGTEDEIKHTLEDLSYYYEHRQALESEILSLFSGLVKREQITHNHVHNHEDKDEERDVTTAEEENIKNKQGNRRVNKFLKKIMKQTFRDRQPEGRFGKYSKQRERTNQTKDGSYHFDGPENILVSIDPEAMSNLRDINTLLHRERGGDYDEMEGVTLYKYPRCASVYIFSQNFISSAILPLCSILTRGSLNEEIDVDGLVNELIYFFYQITQPPSENWYNYWITAENIYKAINVQMLHYLKDPSKEKNKENFTKNEEKNKNVMKELKYRTRVIDDYINGLNKVRNNMENNDIWSLIGEFRLKLEHFKQNGYIAAEDKEELNELKRKQEELSRERDELIRDQEVDEEEEEEEGRLNRLRKDKNVAMENKKRIKEIRSELYSVTTKINEKGKMVEESRNKSEFHMRTVRILISQVLNIRSNMEMLYLLNEYGLLTVIRQELLTVFTAIRKAILPVTYTSEEKEDPQQLAEEEKEEYEYYPSYLTQLERNSMWQYMRMVYNILTGIDITVLISSSSRDREEESESDRISREKSVIYEEMDKEKQERKYLIELYRINPKLYNKHKSRLYSYEVRNANYNQKNNYNYIFKYTKTNVTGQMATTSQIKDDKERENLQNEINLLIGINNNFEHITTKIQTNREEEKEKKQADYELILMLLLCCNDINREVEEEYYEPYDKLMLLSIKSFVIKYYSMMYMQQNRRKDNLVPKSYLFLSIKRYISEDNIFTKLLLNYLNQLIKKLNHQSNQIIVQLIQHISVELSFVQSFHTRKEEDNEKIEGVKEEQSTEVAKEEEYINNICKELFVVYLQNNIRIMLFNIMKNYKMSYSKTLFVAPLRIAMLLEHIIEKIGSVEFVPITGFAGNEKLLGKDMEDELWEEEEEEEEEQWEPKSKRRVRVDVRNIYNSKNNNFIRNDIIRNGRIAYNALLLLVSGTKKGREVLLSYLEKVPKTLLYDIKYFLLINSYLTTSLGRVTNKNREYGHFENYEKSRDERVENQNLGKESKFFMQVLESFFDKWLLEDNKIIMLELFYNKNVGATSVSTNKVNYNVNSKYYIDPIENNDYNQCPILQGVLDQDQEDIIDIMTTLSIAKDEQKVEKKSKIDDELLMQYYNRFKYMKEDLVKYLSDLLNIPTKKLEKHLNELLEKNKEENGPSKSKKEVNKDKTTWENKELGRDRLEKALGKLYREYKEEAIEVIRELEENLKESVEMYKLGGGQVEVIEPMQLTEEMKNTNSYQTILRELNIEETKNEWKETKVVEQKLLVLNKFVKNPFELKEEEQEFKMTENEQEEDEEDYKEQVDVHNITSKDIIKLLIQIKLLYINNNNNNNNNTNNNNNNNNNIHNNKSNNNNNIHNNNTNDNNNNVDNNNTGEKLFENSEMSNEGHVTTDDSERVKEDEDEKMKNLEMVEINELIAVCYDVIENSDQEDYMRYLPMNFKGDHLVDNLEPETNLESFKTFEGTENGERVNDLQESERGKEAKLGRRKEKLVRRLLSYCNLTLKAGTVRLADNRITSEIIKNRINVIKSLYRMSKEQLENILNKQLMQEQELPYYGDQEETTHYGDEEGEEQTYDYAEFDFPKTRSSRRTERMEEKEQQKDKEKEEFEREVNYASKEKGTQKKQVKKTSREKRKKKLKRSDFVGQDEVKERELEEDFEGEEIYDYREFLGVKTLDGEGLALEREHVSELRALKRVPDLVAEIHNRSLELARNNKLVNNLTYNKLVHLASKI